MRIQGFFNLEGENMIINESGMNWNWFTELEVNQAQDGVTILDNYRLHRFNDAWPEKNLKALHHPNYYHETIWKKSKDGIALEYFVPDIGWLPILNPKKLIEYDKSLT